VPRHPSAAHRGSRAGSIRTGYGRDEWITRAAGRVEPTPASERTLMYIGVGLGTILLIILLIILL